MAQRTRLGRYELIRPLGKGGMGEVFLAHQLGPKGFTKLVVVKRIRPELASDPHFVKMFLDEAWIAAALTHPNITQIFDLAQEDGEYWMAMEYVHGRTLEKTLRTVVDKGDIIPPPIAGWLCAQVLRGLHYAHELRDVSGRPMHMIHRDLSPDNVLVTFQGGVKLVDFGIAKARGRGKQTSEKEEVQGKWAYMSPEQLRGDPIDFSADLYAVGVLLHELVTGSPLEAGSTEPELGGSTAPPSWRPVRRGAGMPVFLREVARRALSDNKASRFASAAEMAEALEGFVRGSGQVVEAPQIAAWMQSIYGVEAAQNSLAAPEAGGPGIGTFSESRLKTMRTVSPVLAQRLQRAFSADSLAAAVKLDAQRVPRAAPAPVPAPVTMESIPAAPEPALTPALMPTTGELELPPFRSPTITLEVPVEGAASEGAASEGRSKQRRDVRVVWLGVAVVVAGIGVAFAVQTVRGQPLPSDGMEGTNVPSDDPAPVHLAPTPTARGARALPPSLARRTDEHPGTLDLHVTTWTEVSLDGNVIGMGPLVPFQVDPGSHRVVFRNSKLRLERAENIVVPAGGTITVSDDLAPPR